MTKTRLVGTAFLFSLLLGCAGSQRPVVNVSPARHPNLAAAQELCQRAWQRVTDAQRANEWDMGGHAQRARDLLAQASEEIKLAAMAANRHR
jgi:hypothetical protein